MIPVEFTIPEQEIAITAGRLRYLESRFNGRNPSSMEGSPTVWNTDIRGAGAEMAFCKALGIYFDGNLNSFKGPDAVLSGYPFQIRSTDNMSGSLIVRDNDPEDHIYALVLEAFPKFWVVGWIKGRDAKRPEWRRGPNGDPPAFFVPQESLNKFKGDRG